MKEYTPEHISYLASDEIFVFGSNLQGAHGGGAARYAYEHFGAEWGVGVGMTGHCYAIPTMHGGVKEIKPYVDDFINYAESHPQYRFLVTPIGCGIAGFTPEQMAPLFAKAINIQNIILPREFYEAMLNSKVKQCAKGHYYTGNSSCPYCGAVEAYIPICPHCGKSIRQSLPSVNWPIVGSIEGSAYDHMIPWNYGWDGICENCRHNFNIKMSQKLDENGIKRETTIKVSSRLIVTHLDALVGLSGVEIEQQTCTDGKIKMFLSTNELRFIINALKRSPIIEQRDWNEDRT